MFSWVKVEAVGEFKVYKGKRLFNGLIQTNNQTHTRTHTLDPWIGFVGNSIKANQETLYGEGPSQEATSVSVSTGINWLQSMCIIWGCPFAITP